MNLKTRTIRFLFNLTCGVVLLSLPALACSSTSSTPATERTASDQPVLSRSGADPQRVEFQAEDGKKLVGYYYASKYADAPVMILMHGFEGDLCDWVEIAGWLQNRDDENPAEPGRCTTPEGSPWRDPSWFPPMASDASIAVFIFDFRGYGESEAGEMGTALEKDARAAFKTAAGLPGVDAKQIAAVGADFGADGAAYGCLLYNREMGDGCTGAFSLSPGNYPSMQYSTVIAELAPIAALCISGELDTVAAQTCASADRQYYAHRNYLGSAAHGMALLSPALEPSSMILIQVFIGLAFGEDVQRN